MSASALEITDRAVSNDDIDLTKLSAEELLAVVAELRQENKSLLKARNKVGLTFKRIPEDGNDSIARLEDNQIPFLTKIDSLSVTKQESTDGNIALIEGENLAALATLQMTHKGKVDVIYIDPPYNTGNDDFIYEDKRMYKSEESDLANLEETLDGKVRTVGKDDPFRHSKWLSFMERRLFLAKELLSETGVIFVSIDDNEQARLKLLMDSIFGESNFVANIVLYSNPRGKQSSKNIAETHEYVFVYQKSNELSLRGYGLTDEQKKEYNKFENGIPYREIGLRKRGTDSRREDSPNLFFPIFFNQSENSVSLTKTNDQDIVLLPRLSDGTDGRWRWGRDKVQNDSNQLVVRAVKAKNGDSYDIFQKDFLKDDKTRKAKSLWLETEINYDRAATHLRDLFGTKVFDYSKPLFLIKKLISLHANKNAIILDFFAGSGTTGHAVAELNKEDGGNRSCILVTNNEGGIARNVTRERLTRVLTGENWADGKEHEPLPGNLSYYRLDFKTLSTNPITTAQILESKFDSLVSLENNALTVVENSSDEDYAIYRNSSKVVFIWKNLFSLYDGEFEELLESIKGTMDVKEFIAYIPSESEDAGISVDGWKIIPFPHDYIERYESMIALMRHNQTLPNSK